MGTVRFSGSGSGALDATEIAARAGVTLTDCYQCGKCSAGCPMADDMDLPPQRVMRLLQMGQVERVLEARSPWICAGCLACSARCPQDIDIAGMMREVRRESHAQGRAVVKESDVFETQFVDNIRAGGRNNEQYLAAFYNLKSGHFMQDMTSAPQMFVKGLVGVMPQSVSDKAAVKRLVDRCLEGEQGGERA